MVEADVVLGALAATIVLGFLGQLFFRFTRVSDILVLMAFGWAMGVLVLPVNVDAFRVLAPVIGTFALLIILFEGGLDLHIRELMSGLGRAGALAAVGFASTVAFVGAVGYLYLALEPLQALLLGCILGGSSSIAVMPVVRRLAVHPKSRVVLSVESALTDVLCVVGAVTLLSILELGSAPGIDSVTREIAGSFSIAMIIGLAAGIAWLKLLDWIGGAGNTYMLTVAGIFLLFLAIEWIGGTGAIGILVFGVVLGNARGLKRSLKLKGQGFGRELRQFQSEVAFVVRAFFFVYLGLIFDPTIITRQILIDTVAIWGALVAGRFVAVSVAGLGSQRMRRDLSVWMVMMPRGLAAAVLASLPVQRGIVGTENFVAYASLIIVLTNFLASFAGMLARKGEPEEFEMEDPGDVFEFFDRQVNKGRPVRSPAAAPAKAPETLRPDAQSPPR